jgi:hypothetical protein
MPIRSRKKIVPAAKVSSTNAFSKEQQNEWFQGSQQNSLPL